MATFTYNSNTTVNGTSNADLLLGVDTAGNNNDIVYGHQGDDTIEATFASGFSLNNSTLYGGAGNDLVYANNHNVIYGNQGNDFLEVFSDTDSGVYGNNNTIYGGAGDDTIGLDGPGNGNVAYGGAGSNTIYFGQQFASTLYGGSGNAFIAGYGSTALTIFGTDPGSSIYGNDTLDLPFGLAASTGYGGQGNDSIYSAVGTGNTYYGGGGNDTLSDLNSSADVLYGNQGNDTIFAINDSHPTAYGGQNNDFIFLQYSAHGVLYGNKGNDLIYDAEYFSIGNDTDDGAATNIGDDTGSQGSSVLYGGQGNDSLVALGAGGDTMYGGQGHDWFQANDFLDPATFPFDANHMITVGDFIHGNDTLSMSSNISGTGHLTKDNDLAANNANDAISFADAFYSSHSGSEYLFIYGGAGAGYLFYNGDDARSAPVDGMILVGDNAESSLSESNIETSNKLAV